MDFPEDVETLPIETLSFAKLRAGDGTEIRRVADAMRDLGAFYLDLSDHEEGVALLREIAACRQLAQTVLNSVSTGEKQQYQLRKEPGPVDKGYVAWKHDADNEPLGHETCNIPWWEILNGQGREILPPWLVEHEDLLASTIRQGNQAAQVLLRSLEQGLELSPGTLIELHDRTEKRSGSLLRFLRYISRPAMLETSGKEVKFPPHKDYTTVSMLFTWHGGLQMLRSHSAARSSPTNIFNIAESEWVWVRPQANCALINGGWLLENFTDHVFRAAWHRVLPCPGAQGSVEKYSVLLGLRAHDDVPMKPVTKKHRRQQDSTVGHQLDGRTWEWENSMTCHEWTVKALGNFVSLVTGKYADGRQAVKQAA